MTKNKFLVSMKTSTFWVAWVLTACSTAPDPDPSTLIIANKNAESVTVYVVMGVDSQTSIIEWAKICTPSSPWTCQFSLPAGGVQKLSYTKALNAAVSFHPPGCGVTQAEVSLRMPTGYNVVDISMVNNAKKDRLQVISSLPAIVIENTLGDNANATGVYPRGCDICTARRNSPCGPYSETEGCKAGTPSSPQPPCQVNVSDGSLVEIDYIGP